ncbi:SIS domain-containing protein [Mesorhizobium sp. NZP2298]|uniref:SIS domain-containing protein n=1 Tax=Mesorhizobium sp. NZP2298 TaxID=2483403 RepID=UPI001551E980|nr:SIS domain-containing protein [Mesorhizobium sp. NZP2298]QKC98223.1 SIS domain-containing protein [Mesorhizobium sp. NZP2298]
MLNFDRERFLKIQSGAVALADGLEKTIGRLIEAGAPNIHFLGAGGAAILMQPAVQLLRRKSTFPVFSDNLAELMAGSSVNLTKGSIVILPSLSGTTKESVEFLDFAKSQGATILTLVGHANTPLGRAGDHVFVNFAADDTSSESFYMQSLIVALAVMKHRGELDNYDALLTEMKQMPQVLLAMKEAFEPQAAEFARTMAASDYHIFTGAGNVWPEAFYFGMCILEEMQWIRTRPVHASDFFHGTLELVEKGVSVVLLKGEDVARPLADRVERFVPQVGGSLTVLDTASLPARNISAELRGLMSPAFLATVLERAAAHLEVLRNHPLTTRRYYRRVAY